MREVYTRLERIWVEYNSNREALIKSIHEFVRTPLYGALTKNMKKEENGKQVKPQINARKGGRKGKRTRNQKRR
jgi:hypothetical protein